MLVPSVLADLLAQRAESVCRHLLPGGRRKVAEWVCGNLSGGKGESMKVRIGGEDASRIGIWSDFATGQTGGDLLDLWMAVRGLTLKQAMAEAQGYLGVVLDGAASRPQREYRIPEKPKCAKVKPETELMHWLEGRGFSPQTIADFRLAVSERGEIVFPYLRPDGTFVNAKYRALPKQFRQEVGAEPCLFGWQVIESHYPKSRWCVLVEGECLTGDAQLLTPEGWIALQDYVGGEVAQWQEGRIEFVEPLARVEKPFDGELIEYHSGQFYSLTTPGHKMVSLDRRGKPYFHTAQEGPKSSAHHVPRCGMLDGPGIPLDNAQIALCLAVSADAAIDVRKNAYGDGPARNPARYRRYARFGFKKQRKITRLERIVRECGLDLSSRPIANEYHSICLGIPDWVPGRRLPWEWIGRATLEQREFILHELIEWDGNRVPNRTMTEYATKLLENAEWVQALAHTTGRCSTIVYRENQFGAWFKVTILNEKSQSSWQSVREDRIPHDGMVYCVTVPSGAIVVRQKGIISITGNCDAMSFHQWGIPALSVPNGGGTGHKHDWIETDFDELMRFDTLYLALDQDEPGRLATDEIARRLGIERCRIVEIPFPHKDANELLMAGWTAEQVRSLLDGARSKDPDELKSAAVFEDAVVNEFEGHRPGRPPTGVRSPWKRIGSNLMFRPGETTLWFGYNGSGKSGITNHVAAKALSDGSRWCIASLEMPPRKTLHRLVCQLLDTNQPSTEQVRACIRWLGDKLWLFDVAETTKADRLLAVFDYARRRYDIQHYIIDSFTKCGIDEDDFNAQKRLMDRITDKARKTDAHFHVVCHSRKGESERVRPDKLDLRGAAAITDMADNVISVWRDKEAEERGESRVEVEVHKQRHHSWEGRLELCYRPAVYRFDEAHDPEVGPYYAPLETPSCTT